MIQSELEDNHLSLSRWQKRGLLIFSFLAVAFGQPVWTSWLGLLVAMGGYACFWRVLLTVSNPKERFCIAMGWYAGIQVFQLSWFFSHPYLYIYVVTLICAWLMGFQWGILSIWIKPQTFLHFPRLLALAGLWTLFDWSRLFLLSGFPFNPVGLSLTSGLYPMQFAALTGVYGLTFWVILTNLLLLRAWISPKSYAKWTSVCVAALVPYLFGWAHFSYHESLFDQDPKFLNVVLVQSSLPIEENIAFQSQEEARQFILDEWHQILATLQKQVERDVGLIVLPENLVPYGTFLPVFPIEEVRKMFEELFGKVLEIFPVKSFFEELFWDGESPRRFVSNGYIAQTLSNYFNAHVVIGLEDSHYINKKKTEAYSSAFHFIPGAHRLPERYDKRILVPMGEYIPFSWCQNLAKQYGIVGSYVCGEKAKVFKGSVPMGVSICYEEMFGDLMRENRLLGAELLVNLTNDGWYPNSLLPKQHFDHARLRTVENGIPLIRACNTGVTGAIDSLGRVVGVLGNDHVKDQGLADSIFLEIPLYHYKTFYSQYGDLPVIAFSFFCLFLGALSGFYKV